MSIQPRGSIHTPGHLDRGPNIRRVQPSSDNSGPFVSATVLAMDQAVLRGDLTQVRELIGRGADVNVPYKYTTRHNCRVGSLLHLAIELGYKDIALALLAAGADVHAKDESGWTALRWACYMELEEVVQTLIDKGSPVDERDRHGETPLVARERDNQISMCLLRAGASCEGLQQSRMDDLFDRAYHNRDLLALGTLLKNGCSVSNLTTEEQEELLHKACSTDAFVAHALLKDGCSVSILSREEQEELLHHACREGNVVVVRTLLKNGCGVNKLTQLDLHYLVRILQMKEIEEILHPACRDGNVLAVGTLFKNGCSVSILSREEQEELLHHACHWRDVFVAYTLLKKDDSKVSILSREEQEELLHHACREGNAFVARTLLKHGCSVKKLTQEDLLYLVHILSKQEIEELLHYACSVSNVFAVGTLLKDGCSVSLLSRDEQEELLHHACFEDDVFVAHTLLKDGRSVSILFTEEQEELLHHACHKGDVFVACTLLKDGCSVSILSAKEQEELLYHACREGDVFVIHTLLKNGCSVSILSVKEQEELLHHACCESDVFVVCTLLKDSCNVRMLSTEEQEKLIHYACHQDGLFVVHTLLKNGCSVHLLSREEQEKLLHHACHEDDVFVVRTLLKSGCSVRILSREEQERLVNRACHKGDVLLVLTLLRAGCNVSILSRAEQEAVVHHACRAADVLVAHTLLKGGCRVSVLSIEEQEDLLYHACCEGDVFVVEALLAGNCDINCIYSTGLTPLMVASVNDHDEVLKKLILEGANLGLQNLNGETALHLAATHNTIQCGILLAEGGASVRTKNNLSQTPFDLASTEFEKAIKEALSFTTRKILCIIGNAESGKSTLIAALQAESNSFFGKIINRFRRVDDRRQRTAGIETVPHSSQRYGEVLFFDFAGQDDYHGPHQMFLESLISKPGVSMTLLLVVKMTEEEESIVHQLHRWLSPVALMAPSDSPPQVIIIGSFLDKVKSKEEATTKLTRCIEATRRDLKELSLQFVGSSFLNCRQPQSQGIDQLYTFLQDIPVPAFGATHTCYSLAWVLFQMKSSITAQAVQLKEFSKWVQVNKDNLPRNMPPTENVCQDLSAAGHALYLPNRENLSKSWLVLDLPSILHKVYGTLFSQYKEIVNEFGLIQCRHLAEVFPDQDLEMVQKLLISLEFCLPVDPLVLKVELSKLTQSEETTGWLFFPALISAKPPQSTPESLPQQSVCYLCWQLRTSKKHSISARLLQTILLRLAAHFVVKQHNEEGVQQHCCSIWWNGIEWKSIVGVGITVCIINNRVIQVTGRSVVSADKSCQYLADVISDILSAVRRISSKLAAAAYIVQPSNVTTLPEGNASPPPNKLFAVKGIQSSIIGHKEFTLSMKDKEDHCNMVPITDLFGGCTPSLKDIERIVWPQPDPSDPEPNQLQSDVFSQTVFCEFTLQVK